MISSEQLLEKWIIDVGKSLVFPPYYVGNLFGLLDKLVYNLSKVGPFPSRSMQYTLWSLKHALIAPKLLRHPNADVRVSVALCIYEILRITAPIPLYSDEQMKEVFQIIVAAFGSLSPEYKCYYTSFSILNNVARTKLCLKMFSLKCDKLLIEMFQQFMTVAQFLTVAQFHCPNGECRLENMRTLCVACLLDVTAAQCAERRSARAKAKKQLKVIISNLKNGQNMEGNDANLMDEGHLEIEENLVEDELLIKVPGSAYSGVKALVLEVKTWRSPLKLISLRRMKKHPQVAFMPSNPKGYLSWQGTMPQEASSTLSLVGHPNKVSIVLMGLGLPLSVWIVGCYLGQGLPKGFLVIQEEKKKKKESMPSLPLLPHTLGSMLYHVA